MPQDATVDKYRFLHSVIMRFIVWILEFCAQCTGQFSRVNMLLMRTLVLNDTF